MNPSCPECHKEIIFIQSFINFNPKKYHCPNCKKRIEISSFWKEITKKSFFCGTMIAVVVAANDLPIVPIFLPLSIIVIVSQWFSWQKVEFSKYVEKTTTD